MNRLSITLVGCLALLLASASRGESPSETEQSLQKAQAKLDCCYRTATAFLAKTGDKENAFALEESQKTWEKYRDADLKFEVGIIDSNDEFGKRLRATILLRLTTERIDALESRFEDQLCNPSEIRIRNGSGVDLHNVIVSEKKYGDLKPGETTTYQQWDLAYEHENASVETGSKPLRIQLIDRYGERPLGEGKFTYVLTIDSNGRLDIFATKDSK